MEAFVTGLHVILCLFLILVVLLQPGKGADFGAMMGGSTGQTGSAAQGATLIGKLTAVVAALFMVTSMALAWFSNQGQSSVITDDALEQELLEQEGEKATEPGAGDEAPETEAAPEGDAGGEPEGDAGGEEPEGDAGGDEAPAGEAGGEAPAGDAGGEAPAGDAGGEAPADEAGGDEAGGDEAEGAPE